MKVTLAGSVFPYKPSDDQLSRTSIELAAFDGEVGNGILVIQDPASTYDVYTGRQALIEEGSVTLSNGFMVDQDRTRGFTPAVAREYSFGLADANALLDGFRISRQRPSENDVERVLAFAAADGPSWLTDWVIDANHVTMPAKKYYSDGGWTTELIPDVVAFTGKTLFLHDKADGDRCLHYHILTDGHACGLAISDVISESLGSSTTFFPGEPQRTRTSIDLRNSVKGVDQSGRVSIQTDATSISHHDADGLQHEVQVDIESTSVADLEAQVSAYLASQKDDLDTWTCTIGPLDETALGLIRVGDLIHCTSVVMGLDDDVKRINHMTLFPVMGEGSRSYITQWFASLELGAPVRRRKRVGATISPPGPTPPPPPDPYIPVPVYPTGECETSGYDYTGAGTYTGLGPPTVIGGGAGNEYTATDFMQYDRSGYGFSDYPYAGNVVDLGNGGMSCALHSSAGIDYLLGGASEWIRFTTIGPGVLTVETVVSPDVPGCFPMTPVTSTSLTAKISGTTTIVDTDTGSAVGILTVTIPDDGECGHFSDLFIDGQFGFVRATWLPNEIAPATLPALGQVVQEDAFIGDGVTTSFTALFPYIPNTFQLLVNGLDWLTDMTETDPGSGTWSTTYAPPLGSTVRYTYKYNG